MNRLLTKTAHLQAPTHKPIIQLVKEQYFYQRTQENYVIYIFC